MTTEIGYVTLAYADEYVEKHFTSEDALRTSWEDLLDEDKEVLLRKSFEAIESLPFTGRRSFPKQTTAFPRDSEKTVSNAVKAAQVENAMTLADTSSIEDAAFYEKLWKYGVDSYSIGNLSEHVGSGFWGNGAPAVHGVISTKASNLLQPYLSGGYGIRGLRR